MYRFIGVFLFVLLNTTFLHAQQLNCSVVINAQKVTNTNQQLIKNLEFALNDLSIKRIGLGKLLSKTKR
jgi:hypothetical protein